MGAEKTRKRKKSSKGVIFDEAIASARSCGDLWSINHTAGSDLTLEAKEPGFCTLTSVSHWLAASGWNIPRRLPY